jgi:mono/diheme cytochrome c family protein/cytochrome c553
MFLNIFIFFVVLALAILAGWLFFKALHASKLWVKIVGGLVSVGACIGFAVLAVLGGIGIFKYYFPRVSPAPELTVASTPEQIARGEYLTGLSCIGCHGSVDAQGNQTRERPLSGGWNVGASKGVGYAGLIAAENLTPGGKLANYTDGEILRALRNSVDKDGHLLSAMSLLPYDQISNADLEAIIAYLRSLPPVVNKLPTGDHLNYIGMLAAGAGYYGNPNVPSTTVIAPPEGVTPEYGKYVATYGDCRTCHGPDMTGTKATIVLPAAPDVRPYVSSISEDQFMEMMRTGVRPNKVPFTDYMPWQNAENMTDNDLAALYLYLTTPVK